MAYINQTEIDNFINKAQQKIAALGVIIAEATENGTDYDAEMLLSNELDDLISSLIDPWLDWQEKDIMRYIHYYNNKAKLTDYAYINIPALRMEVVWPVSVVSGGEVTQAELDAEIAARIAADAVLQAAIDVEKGRIDSLDFSTELANALLEYTKTVDLFLPTGDNLTALQSLTTALVAAITANSTHAADTDIHVTPAQKTYWSAKVETSDSRLSDARTPLAHTHAIADVIGLLTTIQSEVDSYVSGLGLQDGVTPAFASANVIAGTPLAASIDDSGGPTALVLNLTIPPPEKGDPGDPFTVGTKGLASDRFDSIYDGETSTFTYLGTDDGNLYYRNPSGGAATTSGGWLAPIPFTGENGWSPVLGLITVNSEKEVYAIIDWVGGTGDKPVLTPPANPPDPLIWYIGESGPTVFVNDAKNVKGNTGNTGADGQRFVIDASDVIANKSSYDGELQGYTLLITDVSPNVIYQKASDASADWVGPYTWQGADGAPTADTMTKSVYDPGVVAGDVFNMDNMVEGSTNLILTSAERALIASALQSVAFADLSDYPTDSVGVLTNDGVGNLSWASSGGTWVPSLTNSDASGTVIQNTVTTDISGQTGTAAFTGIDWDITTSGRTASGAINFLDLKKDGVSIYSISDAGSLTLKSGIINSGSGSNLILNSTNNIVITPGATYKNYLLGTLGTTVFSTASSGQNQLVAKGTSSAFSLIAVALTTVNALNITGASGIAASVTGGDLILAGGAAYNTGNNNGGSTILRAGIGNGTGVAGSIKIQDSAGISNILEVNDTGIAFFAATPIAKQNTTSQTPATFVANTSGISDDSATWGGYTMGDVVAILQAYGLFT